MSMSVVSVVSRGHMDRVVRGGDWEAGGRGLTSVRDIAPAKC